MSDEPLEHQCIPIGLSVGITWDTTQQRYVSVFMSQDEGDEDNDDSRWAFVEGQPEARQLVTLDELDGVAHALALHQYATLARWVAAAVATQRDQENPDGPMKMTLAESVRGASDLMRHGMRHIVIRESPYCELTPVIEHFTTDPGVLVKLRNGDSVMLDAPATESLASDVLSGVFTAASMNATLATLQAHGMSVDEARGLVSTFAQHLGGTS